MLLTKWVCGKRGRYFVHNWFQPPLGRLLDLYIRMPCGQVLNSQYSLCSSQKFRLTNHWILISFHLQFPHLFWTWSTTTMALQGDRLWDAQLKGHLFLILSGWFARILRSMETKCFFFICGQNFSFLTQRAANACYFFCWPFRFLFGLSLINYQLGSWAWTLCVHE